MTRQDRVFKWLLYALGVLPVLLVETTILNRFPLFGVIPVLLPLAGVAVALFEGPLPGGVFGLCLGVIADGVYPGVPGGMTFGLALLGALTGLLIASSGLKPNLFGCLLCSAGALVLMDLVRVLWGAAVGLGPLPALLAVAGKEIGWSLPFALPIYGLFKLIHRRVSRLRS